MTLPFHHSGGAGWVLLAGLVIAWDSFAPETMSAAFERSVSTPAGRVLVPLATAVVVAHLFNVLPENRDPLRLLVKSLRTTMLRVE